MKALLFFLFLLSAACCCTRAYAGAPDTTRKKTVRLYIYLKNHCDSCKHTDSVLVTLDQYNHTKAGVIRAIYRADAVNRIVVDEIPPGKYMVSIRFLNFHNDHVRQIMYMSRRRQNEITIKLDPAEAISKDRVVIPVQDIDWLKLSILNM